MKLLYLYFVISLLKLYLASIVLTKFFVIRISALIVNNLLQDFWQVK